MLLLRASPGYYGLGVPRRDDSGVIGFSTGDTIIIPGGTSSLYIEVPGLYQFNLTIPLGSPNGDLPIVCAYNGASTPSNDVITVHQ